MLQGAMIFAMIIRQQLHFTHNDSFFGVIFDIESRFFVPLGNFKDTLVLVNDADEFDTRHEVLQAIAVAAWIFLPRTP